MAKGKEHKKYEFGTKASVVLTKTGGIIVGAVAHEENLYDGHTLPEVLQQTEALTGSVPRPWPSWIAAIAAPAASVKLKSWCPAPSPRTRRPTPLASPAQKS